jgi:cysteine desulfurase
MDYAATTPLDPRVLEAMKPYYTTIYGNASSINLYGLESKNALEDARKTITDFMSSESRQLIFTGSATEANNLILKGHAFKVGKENTHIVISTIEHDCILNAAKWLESKGFTITYIPVNRLGIINMKKLEEILKKRLLSFL